MQAGEDDHELNGPLSAWDSPMTWFRNYWIYSLGLSVAWAITLTLVLKISGPEGIRTYLLVFGGFCIGWISTTIARFVYPPPKRWTSSEHQA